MPSHLPLKAFCFEPKVPGHVELDHKTEFRNLGRVNLFVGANNSGKSRLLRLLASHPWRHKYQMPAGLNFADFAQRAKEMNIEGPAWSMAAGTINSIREEFEAKQIALIREVMEQSASRQGIESLRTKSQMTVKELYDTVVTFAKVGLELCERLDTEYRMTAKLDRCYVPVLRSLRRLPPDVFTRLAQRDYFEAPEGIKPEISTGLELVAKLRGMLLGTRRERTRVREFERLLGQLFFDGQEITLVPKEPDAEGFADLVIKVGDEMEQKVHDLGDGLQSLIILTFYPFVTEAPTAYFIEEPELFLHPGQQRRLFDFWARHEQTNHHSFFIATHSNHLLDLSLDFESVSIFRVTKDTSEKAKEGSPVGEIRPHIKVALVGQGDPTTLQQLGVRQSSVFLVNATLWVEGPTDYKYLRRILELWCKKTGQKPFAEDVHYSFVMYGGAAITHWNFGEAEDPAKITAKRLCAQALVIADQDNGKKHQALEVLLGERFVRLRCREIENILPADVVWKIVCDYEKQPPSSAPFAQEAYRDKYLGKFIDDHLGSNRKRKACYAENSGTIKEKVDWANRVLEFLTDPTQLTADAEEIAERMYNHIALHNP